MFKRTGTPLWLLQAGYFRTNKMRAKAHTMKADLGRTLVRHMDMPDARMEVIYYI